MVGREKYLIKCENIAKIARLCKAIGKAYYNWTVQKTLSHLNVHSATMGRYINTQMACPVVVKKMKDFIIKNEGTDDIEALYEKYFG